MSDWFEVKTDPYDPTHIEMRRMTADEVEARWRAQAQQLAHSLGDAALDVRQAAHALSLLAGMDIVSGIADGICPGSLPHTRTPRCEKRCTRKQRRR